MPLEEEPVMRKNWNRPEFKQHPEDVKWVNEHRTNSERKSAVILKGEQEIPRSK